jgi:hypothetical protein
MDIEALVPVLNDFLLSWRNSRTVEDKLIIESRTVEFFERILADNLFLPGVSSLESPHLGSYGKQRVDVKHKANMHLSRINKLIELYISNYNNKVKTLMELAGALKRVRQKKAALDLWDREKAKWVIAEKFLNLDNISADNSVSRIMNVDTSQGLLTLPIESTSKLLVNNVRIVSGNGFIGNSDEDVTTHNIRPQFIFDGNPDTWFEYERLDSGPCELTVSLDYSTPEIVNYLAIRAVNVGSQSNFEIEDILFTISGYQTVSIKDLVSPAVGSSDFYVKTIGTDIYWSMSFLPVTCSNIVLKLKQKNYYRIQTSSNDGRAVSRKRYGIAIKSISAARHKYAPSGGISSKAFDLPEGLYAAESSSRIFPNINNLYSAKLDLSVDNGESWNLDIFGFENSETSNTVTMDGLGTQGFWRLLLQRDNEAFKNIASYTDQEIPTTLKVASSLVSPAISPARIALEDKPYNKKVGAYQPRILRCSDDDREKIQIFISPTGTEPGEGFVVPLPIELDEEGYNIDPDNLVVYGGNRELYSHEDGAGTTYDYFAITQGTGTTDRIWALGPNWKNIAVQMLRPGVPVYWRMPAEQVQIEQRSDGYYVPLKNKFDPDKKRINIKGLSPYSATTSETLSPSKYRFSLKYGKIVEDSFKIGSDTSLVFTELSTRAEVLAARSAGGGAPDTIQYYLDATNGKLYFDRKIGEVHGGPALVKVVYDHVEPKILKDEDYKIWVEDGIDLKGLVISPDKLECKDCEFKITSTPVYHDIIDINTGSKREMVPLFTSGKAIDLPYDYIVKYSISVDATLFGRSSDFPAPTEMEYADGITEFLGLINMDQEATVEMNADGLGIVQFKLAAGSAWYKPLGIEFLDADVFKVEEGNVDWISDVGDYYVADDGVVSVKVGSSAEDVLIGGIKYMYSYVDPTHDSANLFSVDYELGILYGSEDIRRGTITIGDYEYDSPVVRFKVARYKAEYDIVRDIDSYSYDSGSNIVAINTENILKRINKRVKVFYAIPDDFIPLRDMKDFFSPLISNISFRFQ